MRRPAVRFASVSAFALAATLASSPLSAQAPVPAPAPYTPSSWIGLGLTQLSNDGASSSAYSLAGGIGYKKLYFTVGANIPTESGGDPVNDYQIGYLFMHRQTPGSKGGAVGMGITGGFWDPATEGVEMSPLASFNMFGALGKTSRFVGHVMGGLIFPEGGDQVMIFRVGIGYTL